MSRKRYGHRRWVAQFQRHNGTVDDNNQPTYTVGADWDVVIEAWPCELIATSGGETVRGRQTSPETTHLAYGEYFGAESASPDMRAVIEGTVYGVVSVLDLEGLSREMRIELRLEPAL